MGPGDMCRQAGHAIAHLCFDGAKPIGSLAFAFEHLRQFRPGTVSGKLVTSGDRAPVQAAVSFLYGASRAKIVGRCRGASELSMGLEEHVDVHTFALLIVLDGLISI
jgi:hypothetical protein